MAKYFLFMYIEESRLKSYLDLAIALLNPRERWPAHVTIAGPFKRKLEVPRSLAFVQEVRLLGRGRFDTDTKHTVFLHVGSRDMAARIDKPDFASAIPHLSLYNGRDREVADLLFSGLGSVSPFGVFYSEQLKVVESNEQHTFNFRMQVDTSLLPSTHDRTLEELWKLSKARRVEIALEAIKLGLLRPFNLRRALRPTYAHVREQDT